MDEDQICKFPDSTWIMMARFVCGVVLHINAQGELTSGLQNMKFALNHDFRFDSPYIVFLSGFMQATSIFVIEIVNFIVIMSSTTYLDVVMNFMALYVISEFDDVFYNAISNIDRKALITSPDDFEDLYKITRTSSHCCPKNDLNEIEDDTEKAEKVQMGISFGDRSFFNKFLRCVYSLYRVIQISLWFYFIPFLAVMASYLAPFYIHMTQGYVVGDDMDPGTNPDGGQQSTASGTGTKGH